MGIADSGFVSGLDPSLSVVDVHGSNSGNLATIINSSSTVGTTRNGISALSRLESLTESDFSLSPVVDPLEVVPIDSERLASTGKTLSKDVQALLYQDGFDSEDFSDKRQNELLGASGLIEKNSRGNYQLNKTLKNAKTDLKALQQDCNSLFGDLVSRSNDDWVSRILLYLAAMVKLAADGVVCQVGNLLEGIENPYVKESVLLLGTGVVFKDFKKQISRSKLAKDEIVALNPFNKPSRTTGRTSRSTSRVISPTSYINNPDAPVTRPIRSGDTDGYGLNFSSPELEAKFNPNLVGLRTGLDIQDPESVTESIQGIDLIGLYEISTLIDPLKVTDLYPDIGYNILKFYRFPTKDKLDYTNEYNLLVSVMDAYVPNWSINENGTSSLRYFRIASRDALLVFGNYSGSQYKEEALLARSYPRNSIKPLLESQYPYLAV